MNTPLTRIQAFEVLALCVILCFGALGVMLLQKMNDKPLDQSTTVTAAHGIETSWHSDKGAHRLWSLTASEDYPHWIQDHISAFTEAQRQLPIEKR